jgi:hypothetical protein
MEKLLENLKHHGMRCWIMEMSLSVSDLLPCAHIFPSAHPSLTLKAATPDDCDNQDSALSDVSDVSFCSIGFC